MSAGLLYRRLPRALAQRARQAHGYRSFASTARAAGSATQSRFDWEDPLGFKHLLTEEELSISAAAERYCQENLLPRVLRTAHRTLGKLQAGLLSANVDDRGLPR